MRDAPLLGLSAEVNVKLARRLATGVSEQLWDLIASLYHSADRPAPPPDSLPYMSDIVARASAFEASCHSPFPIVADPFCWLRFLR